MKLIMETALKHSFYTLGSGLRLVVVPMPATKTATAFVLVGTGSKYEAKNINGISHFLEHMMFKGTEKRPGTMEIASEKGVIVEEINMYQDLPQRHVGDLFEQLIYGDQPAGWKIAGEKEIVTELKRDQFVHYFNSHYVAENTIVAIAGNVDAEEVKNKVEKYFKNIRHGKLLGKPAVTEKHDGPRQLINYKKTDQTHFILGFRAFNMFDDKRYALSVLAKVLGGGMSSRLFHEVRERRGLAYYVKSEVNPYTDSGYLSISAGVNNEKALDAIKVILDEVNKIKADGVTAAEL